MRLRRHRPACPANVVSPPANWNLLKHMEATVGCTAGFPARSSWRAGPDSPPNCTTVATASLPGCAAGGSRPGACQPVPLLASSQPRRRGQRLVVGSGSAGSRWSRDPALPERRMITRLWVVIWGKTEPRIPKPITVPGGQQVLGDISRMNKECFTESQEVSSVLGMSLLRRDL